MDRPRIETERLILRRPLREDFDAYAANMADEEASHFIGGPQTRAVAWRGFLQLAGAWDIQGFSMFSVIEKASGRWIGRLGPWFPEGWPGPEVGWGIVRDAWGKGYASEGATASMDFAFDVLGWDRVIHSIAPDNIASQGVARKLGSRRLGTAKLPEPYDDKTIDVWGQSRDEWRTRRRGDA
ncbi:GNAT family N-acetyltransferase [Oleiagrimonas soli]|uniref:Acetyltransferase n=1 Tax=Oleiagrimonas soli TaxID=1543381 RepID=A0A099CW95_9GAMM|nr:GNAT family N-acetyltransferase [Oleiagrimonas soli]KGI77994.1 acetyltransferase [Oleiagrimonas soli]MBB6183626.1 RimJ/RimL family protein N-acetyltransferase [Oleiagrimonas soli]